MVDQVLILLLITPSPHPSQWYPAMEHSPLLFLGLVLFPFNPNRNYLWYLKQLVFLHSLSFLVESILCWYIFHSGERILTHLNVNKSIHIGYQEAPKVQAVWKAELRKSVKCCRIFSTRSHSLLMKPYDSSFHGIFTG